MSNVSKATSAKILEAAGKNYGASVMGAPIATQQRFYRSLIALCTKHNVDIESASTAGQTWWNARPMRGPGVDW